MQYSVLVTRCGAEHNFGCQFWIRLNTRAMVKTNGFLNKFFIYFGVYSFHDF